MGARRWGCGGSFWRFISGGRWLVGLVREWIGGVGDGCMRSI